MSCEHTARSDCEQSNETENNYGVFILLLSVFVSVIPDHITSP